MFLFTSKQKMPMPLMLTRAKYLAVASDKLFWTSFRADENALVYYIANKRYRQFHWESFYSGRIKRSQERVSTASRKSATKSDIYAKLCILYTRVIRIRHKCTHTRVYTWKHEWDPREDKRKKISGARASNPAPCLVLLVVRWPKLLEYINHFDGNAWTCITLPFTSPSFSLSRSLCAYSHAQHENINL